MDYFEFAGRIMFGFMGVFGFIILVIAVLEWLLNEFLKRWRAYPEFTKWLWHKEKFHKWLEEQKNQSGGIPPN